MQHLQRLCQGSIGLGGWGGGGESSPFVTLPPATTPGRLKKEAGGSPFAKTKKNLSRLPNPGGRQAVAVTEEKN